MDSHSSFLLTSYDDLLGNIGLILKYFVSLLNKECSDRLMESEQSQNSIILSMFLLKKILKSFDTTIECN